MRSCFTLVSVAIMMLLSAACAPPALSDLRLATTTSTYDTGLLDALLPAFESEYNASVDILAVGTGQAIRLGENGDVDVILVHARAREDAFLDAGYGSRRYDAMFNDFILVGPGADPAGVRGQALASEALKLIAQAGVLFASRGDESGTHTRELQLWEAAGIKPTREDDWYQSLGQGMGATLQFANEVGAYTLSDRGTYLALRGSLADLAIMVGGQSIAQNADPNLLNPYAVIPVNPGRHPATDSVLAQQFVDWLTSVEIQQQIAAFGIEQYGQPLFYPNSLAWHAANP